MKVEPSGTCGQGWPPSREEPETNTLKTFGVSRWNSGIVATLREGRGVSEGREEEKGEGEGLDGGVGGSSLVQVKVALPATHYPAAKLPTPRFGVTTPSKHGNQTLTSASEDTLRFDLFLMKS